jgi:isoleucyl-tRNA synthetase
LCEFPSADESLKDALLVERIAMVRGMVEMGRIIRATNNVKNRMPIASMTVVPHGSIEKEVAENMQDLILEELNVREMKFLDDETALVKLSAKPNFLGIKAKGPEFSKNMKDIQNKLANLNANEIRDLQDGKTIEFPFGCVGKDCLLIHRIVPEGMAVEANAHFTVALDLTVTEELKRACIARELVNRIQNRRKDEDYAISDKITITLYSLSEAFKKAVEENLSYIMGETQAIDLVWAPSDDGLSSNDADGEPFSFSTRR